jgi:transposase-like protein
MQATRSVIATRPSAAGSADLSTNTSWTERNPGGYQGGRASQRDCRAGGHRPLSATTRADLATMRGELARSGSVTPRAMLAAWGRLFWHAAGWGLIAMDCVGCGSAAVTERPDQTAQGYRRFRCRDCGKQFNERSDGVLNRVSLPSDIIAFVVFCRLRYRLTLRDLSEILLLRGFTVSHECVRQWEAKLLPVMGETLRKRRHGTGRSSGQSWYVDETYLKVHGHWS